VSAILFEIDGKPVPAGKCSWFTFAPCGCMSAAVVVEGGGDLVATEVQAWKAQYPRAESRRKAKAEGFRMEIGLTERIRTEWVDCTHTPRWGRK
jgi:hypothetical protein